MHTSLVLTLVMGLFIQTAAYAEGDQSKSPVEGSCEALSHNSMIEHHELNLKAFAKGDYTDTSIAQISLRFLSDMDEQGLYNIPAILWGMLLRQVMHLVESGNPSDLEGVRAFGHMIFSELIVLERKKPGSQESREDLLVLNNFLNAYYSKHPLALQEILKPMWTFSDSPADSPALAQFESLSSDLITHRYQDAVEMLLVSLICESVEQAKPDHAAAAVDMYLEMPPTPRTIIPAGLNLGTLRNVLASLGPTATKEITQVAIGSWAAQTGSGPAMSHVLHLCKNVQN